MKLCVPIYVEVGGGSDVNALRHDNTFSMVIPKMCFTTSMFAVKELYPDLNESQTLNTQKLFFN